MVSVSKKEARKAAKGQVKAATSIPIPKKSALKQPVAEEEESGDEEEWESEDEDEENGGVSEAGMRRLMELVSEEDLDDYERAQLADEDEDEDDEDEEASGDEDEDEDEDDVLDDEDVGELGGEGSDEEDDEENEDMEGKPVDDSILVDDADPDAIAVDDLGSDVSLDEDAVPVRKVTANNKPAMRLLTDSLRVTNYPFADHLIISSRETVDEDPSDDLKRETAFYKIALDQVALARKLCAKHDIPFTRPTDYYAEMVKSDDHMERIRTKLVEESQSIKKSEAARKQRELKKYGKQIQVEKLKQREQDKKGFADKIQGLKRKRKEGMELGEEGGDDEFGIAVDDGDDRPARGGSRGRGGAGDRGKSKMPRSARDSKYSLGGGGRRSKQNTKESSNDFAGWSGEGGKGGRGGRGGARGGAGGGSRGGRGASRGGNRPGKSRRAGGRT